MIDPVTLKGFRDYLPDAAQARNLLIRKLERTFEAFGFVPIDTPALEYAEILLGKGGGETEKQVYRFFDNGNRDVALRYDLTVPFARFISARPGEEKIRSAAASGNSCSATSTSWDATAIPQTSRSSSSWWKA
jgi:histidyl-tRNA synthetase